MKDYQFLFACGLYAHVNKMYLCASVLYILSTIDYACECVLIYKIYKGLK